MSLVSESSFFEVEVSALITGCFSLDSTLGSEFSLSSTQTSVNGRVKIRLYKGNAIVIGRMSENNSLYREDLATYSKDDVFNHSLAEGFIYMWGMSNKIWAELNAKTKD